MLSSLKKLVEMVRPDLSTYMRFPVEGIVSSVDVANYTCDVQPLNEKIPLLPKCHILSIWGSAACRVVVLPSAGDKVMVEFENGDICSPYIIGFFPDQGPPGVFIIEGEKARIQIDTAGKVEIVSDSDVEITCVNCKIKASGNVDLGEGGGGVVTSGPLGSLPACLVTGAPIPCSSTVKAKA
jgi:hypothetical protein